MPVSVKEIALYQDHLFKTKNQGIYYTKYACGKYSCTNDLKSGTS